MLVVIHCLKTWRHYLLGSKFIIKIDNSALNDSLMEPKLTPKQACWHEFITEFVFHFEHKAGTKNQATYALGCNMELATLRVLANVAASTIATSMRGLIRYPLRDIHCMQSILKLCKKRKTCQFLDEDGLLWMKGDKLFIPRSRNLKKMLLQECYDTLWAEHPRS